METEPVPPPIAAAISALPAPAVLEGMVLHDPAVLEQQLATYAKSRQLLLDWLLTGLVPGIDYMLIHRKVGPRGQKTDCPQKGDATSPGCKTCGGKATLCKPGSEKLCGLLQLRPRFRRDEESWEMLGSEVGLVALLCELTTPSGVVVSEGRGARHRDQDFGDVNKTLKMAQKSAQTDAVLRCAGLSEIFTQDLEDMPAPTRDTEPDEAPFVPPRRRAAATTTAPSATTEPAAPRAPSLARTLRASVAEAAARNAEGSSSEKAPPDALSRPRVARLMAMLHEAIEGEDVPEDAHEEVFTRALEVLRQWVVRTQGRHHVSHCSWRNYDELCAYIPTAVHEALTAPAQRPPASRVVARRSITRRPTPPRRPRYH
jgi:hypothetical protein